MARKLVRPALMPSDRLVESAGSPAATARSTASGAAASISEVSYSPAWQAPLLNSSESVRAQRRESGQATLARLPRPVDRGADGGVVRRLEVVVDQADVGEAGLQIPKDDGAQEGGEHLGGHGHGAGEALGEPGHAVRHGGRHERADAGRPQPSGRPVGGGLADPRVGVERQVRPVRLHRAHRHERHHGARGELAPERLGGEPGEGEAHVTPRAGSRRALPAP